MGFSLVFSMEGSHSKNKVLQSRSMTDFTVYIESELGPENSD